MIGQIVFFRTKTWQMSNNMTKTSCWRTAKCIFWMFIEKKGDPFDFLPSVCWTPCQNLYMIKRNWTTLETLAEIERERERERERGRERLQRTTPLHVRMRSFAKRFNLQLPHSDTILKYTVCPREVINVQSFFNLPWVVVLCSLSQYRLWREVTA